MNQPDDHDEARLRRAFAAQRRHDARHAPKFMLPAASANHDARRVWPVVASLAAAAAGLLLYVRVTSSEDAMVSSAAAPAGAVAPASPLEPELDALHAAAARPASPLAALPLDFLLASSSSPTAEHEATAFLLPKTTP